MQSTLHIVGAGLAGSEAAWQAAERGVQVIIHEMRPTRPTEAHHTGDCAELVCSNSFRSDDHTRNAVGLLHEEMRNCLSLIMRCADAHKVPAGGALAVDREAYAREVSARLRAHPRIRFCDEEVTELPAERPSERWIIATGPLTSAALSQAILAHTGQEYLAFFDAIAPIVFRDSVDMDKAWFQSRYDKAGPGGTGADYINCPMNRDEYYQFIEALREGEKTSFKEWEKNTPYFEGCLPIEVMAERGADTLRFGPMKPVGLTNPHRSEKPYAVVQLRQDNALGTLYNIVGFQTKLKYGEQQRIFCMIPGLERAEFARLGGIHRNTFIRSPLLLDTQLRLKSAPHIRFAGQITGVEGYVESAACGLIAGQSAAAELHGHPYALPPATTALGALMHHITTGADGAVFQPMNVNFGLFAPLAERVGKDRRAEAYCARALRDIGQWQQHTRAA